MFHRNPTQYNPQTGFTTHPRFRSINYTIPLPLGFWRIRTRLPAYFEYSEHIYPNLFINIYSNNSIAKYSNSIHSEYILYWYLPYTVLMAYWYSIGKPRINRLWEINYRFKKRSFRHLTQIGPIISPQICSEVAIAFTKLIKI